MIETFVILLTAHFLASCVLQIEWTAASKTRWRWLVIDACLATGVAALLLGNLHCCILLTLFSSRLVTDLAKVYLFADRLRTYVVDQLSHVLIAVGLAFGFSDATATGQWMARLPAEVQGWYFIVITLVGGFLLCVPVGGVLIGKMTSPLGEEVGNGAIEGLQQGGKYIGWLERSLVMMLLLIGQYGGIGFLIAAKSILRFGEIKNADQRKTAEIVIIGTFLSFGWALLISTLTEQALTLWMK